MVTGREIIKDGWKNFKSYINANNKKVTANFDNAYYDASTCRYGPINISFKSWNGYGIPTVKAYNADTNEEIECTRKGDWKKSYLEFNKNEIVNKGIIHVKIKITNKYLNECIAHITKMTCPKNTSGFWALCPDHAQWPIYSWDTVRPITERAFYDFEGLSAITIENGEKIGIERSEWLYVYVPTTGLINVGVSSNDYAISSDKKIIIQQNGNQTRCYKAAVHEEVERNFRFSEFGNKKCGEKVRVTQTLSWVETPEPTYGYGQVEKEIQLMPTINVNLKKYNSIFNIKIDENGNGNFLDDPTPLTNAQFKVEAYQRGKDGKLEKLKVTNPDGNGVRRIVPAGKDYTPEMAKDEKVYAIFTETKSPKGYKLLNCPIIAEYSLRYDSNKKKFSWWVMYQVPLENWTYSGFIDEKIYDTIFNEWLDKIELDEAVKTSLSNDYNSNIKNKSNYGKENLIYNHIKDIVNEDTSKNWKNYLKDRKIKIDNYVPWKFISEGDDNGDTFPNRYRSPKDDYLYIERISSGGEAQYIINVFDEAVVEKLKLLKVDADDNNSPLNGAKFTATFENVKEFYIGGNRISGDKPYTFIVDGSIEIQNVVYIDENKPIKIILEEVEVPTAKAGWYYKKLEGAVTIEIEHTQKNGLTNGTVSYTGTETINNGNLTISDYEATLTIPNIRLIDIDGLVWVDGTTGIKPVMSPNGVKDNTERNVSNVLVEIKGDNPRQFNNETATYINDNTIRTDNKGTYKFIGLRWNKEYFVTFNYDGIHYIASNAENYKGAQETAATRTTFNDGYKTINSDMELSYEYNKTANETYGIKERTSILETLSEKNAADKKYPVEMTDTRLEMGSIQDKFNMTASTTKTLYNRHGRNLNLGILKRGTDLALSTNVYKANVSINGQTTVFDYDDLKNQENIDLTKEDLINSSTSDEKLPDYSIYLRSTDYYYRMRKFESNPNFVVTDTEEPNDMQTGDELEVYVTYTLQLDNQANKFAKVKKIRYDYSPYYQFDTEVGRIYYLENGQEVELVKGTDYSVNSNNNIIDINKEIVFDVNSSDNYFGVRTFYIEFRVPDSTLDLLRDGNVKFENKAEIMEYETAEGLIDIDSQPGNYISKSQIEDDNDKANGITLGIKDEVRTISGFVWDDANKNGKFDEGEALVDDVIVQLIELKEKNGKYYEYIWQETLSGSKDVKRMATQKNKEGKFVIENYSHPDGIITTGGYKFEGFIPGDYIIRFIYGDGTTYDLTDNMIKYNGQDYKSTIEGKYTAEWYNNAEYETNVNITRDNESRRLETMSWSTNIDARKGILLKLLDGYTQEDFNLVEKEELFKALKDFKDELDAKLKEAQEDGDDDLEKEINAKLTALDNIGIPDSYTNLNSESIKYLLKNVTLDNTWMCAETAKIKVPVESEHLKDVTTTVEVNGKVTNYKYDFSSMAFGLAKRPETKLKVEKHLKEMVLKASNGQTVLSAYINNNNELDGQIDGLQVITIPEGMPGHGEWIFSVSPVDINTILDGGRLEFSYNIVVKNIGDEDYLGATLRGEYNDANINYEETLKEHAKDVKTAIKSANTTHTLGTYLGQTYYMGGTDSANKVQTEVTGIRDYIANELVVFENGTKNLENIGEIDHYLYNDNYAITEKTKINNVLENQIPTGKLEPNNQYDEYVVNLGKDPLSSTSTLDFFNYIAEITSFSNAVGRRGTYTTVDEDGKLIGKSITPGNAEAVNKHIPDNGARLEPDESTVEEVHIQSALGQDKQATYIWLGIATISIAIIGAGVYVIKRRIMK